ncbi:RHS repeat domain-containing protein [Macellibacteroides fermentans]|uniref:RHS repeat domain-containing protein n=1 Tax=Macellibacteroides fermentans TaxID=879969 RepID=UPI003B93ED78
MGRLKKSNYPDGTQAVITRAWSSDANSVFSITKEETGKPSQTTFYNSRGLELRTSSQRFDNTRILTDNIYDNAGRLTKTSLPFKTGAATLWNTYEYDVYGRLKQLNYASGKSDVYTYAGNSITETKDGISITRTYNAKEELIGTSDPAGSITYQLRPDGQPSSITAPGTIVTRFSYDEYGRQTEINDPSIGLKSYIYDDAGNIKSEKDANGKEKLMEYDPYGRVTKRILPEYETTFTYDGYGALKSEKSSNGTSKYYDYDGFGRLLFSQENVDDRWGGYDYNYSPTTGNLESKDYISSTEGYVVTENYTYQYGTLTEIKRDGQTSIWKLQSEDIFGRPTQIATGPLTRTYSYNSYGLPTSSKAVNSGGTVIQDYGMMFNPVTGNLTSRGDHKNNKYEHFQYDNLNRLTHVYSATSLTSGMASNPTSVYNYNANGNMESKSDAGTYAYENAAKPYAVTSVTLSGNAIPVRLQEITYTSFERPSVLTENNYMATFTYNGSNDRSKMEIKRYNNSQILRYYLNGSHEVDVTPAGEKERLYLGGDAYSAPAVLVKESGSWNVYYICRDHLGSITQITNGSGVMQQELSYDAWGRLRNPGTLAVYAPDTEPTLFLGRGYTGHEHLTMFGLVNMNARLYDPAVGRFLSPDPYVQMTDFSQNYNRFSYAMNNPLVYIDKDGEILLFIVGGALIGSYIGASIKGGSFNPTKWQGAWWQGALWGGAIGAVSGALVGSMWAAGGINLIISGNVYNLSVPLGSVSVSSAGYGSVSLGTGIWGSGGLVYTFGNKKGYSLEEASMIREEGEKSLERFNQMMQNGGSFYIGTGTGVVAETLYSKDLGTWMGKDFKIRNQSWGGEQTNGGQI